MKQFALALSFFGALSLLPGCADSGTDTDVVDSQPAVDIQPADTIEAFPVGWTSPVVEGKLGIGNPAPQLQLAKVVHGEDVAELEPGKVQVVEFWATWCGPCLAGMPHISELAEKYKGEVNFVGITSEDEDTVTSFLARNRKDDTTWADTVKYSLALDAENAMKEQYFRAAGRKGIPCAFIVGRDGIVEWIGHPMAMDAPLASVVEGSYDREGAYTELVASQKSEAARNKVMRTIQKALTDGDYDTAIAELDKQAEANPSESLNWEMVKMKVLSQADRPDDLSKVQASLVEKRWGDSQFLNMIAWGIAAEDTGNDLDLAMKAARRASELEDDAEPSILDTVARVFYEHGDLPGAIEWQQKAVSSCDDEGVADGIAKTLKGYDDELANVKKAETEKKQAEAKAKAATEAKVKAKAQADTEAKAKADAKAADEGKDEENDEEE